MTFSSPLCAQISHKNQWKSHLCNGDQNAADSSSPLLSLPGLINPTIVAQEQEDHVMNTTAPAKFWMKCPDHSVLWFTRQLRNLKFLDAIITGAELQGMIPNQRKSHCTYKNSLFLPIIKWPILTVENTKIQNTINKTITYEFIIQKQSLLPLWQLSLWVKFIYVIHFLLIENFLYK